MLCSFFEHLMSEEVTIREQTRGDHLCEQNSCGRFFLCLRIIGGGATSVRVNSLRGTPHRAPVLQAAATTSPAAGITPCSLPEREAGDRLVGSGATSVKACSLRGIPHRAPVLRAAVTTSTGAGVTDFSLRRFLGRLIGGGATSVKACSLRGTPRRAPALRAAVTTSTGAATTVYRLFDP
jgi:hypothetical protein